MEKERDSPVEKLIDSLFEEAGEFEEFGASGGKDQAFSSENDAVISGKQREAEKRQPWEDDWEDEVVTDEFSLQLKKELESANKS